MARLEERLDSGDYPDASLKGTTLNITLDLLCRNMTRSQAARLLRPRAAGGAVVAGVRRRRRPAENGRQMAQVALLDVSPPIGSGQRHCSCHAGGHHGSHGPKAPGRDLLQWEAAFLLFAVLLGAFCKALFSRLNVPYTVGLLLVGIGFGALAAGLSIRSHCPWCAAPPAPAPPTTQHRHHHHLLTRAPPPCAQARGHAVRRRPQRDGRPRRVGPLRLRRLRLRLGVRRPAPHVQVVQRIIRQRLLRLRRPRRRDGAAADGEDADVLLHAPGVGRRRRRPRHRRAVAARLPVHVVTVPYGSGGRPARDDDRLPADAALRVGVRDGLRHLPEAALADRRPRRPRRDRRLPRHRPLCEGVVLALVVQRLLAPRHDRLGDRPGGGRRAAQGPRRRPGARHDDRGRACSTTAARWSCTRSS